MGIGRQVFLLLPAAGREDGGVPIRRARKRAPSGEWLARLLLGLLAGDGEFETRTCAELRHSGCRNLDGGAGLGILAGTRRALGRLEGAETHQSNVIPFRYRLHYRSHDTV